jgi:hypothetical protein
MPDPVAASALVDRIVRESGLVGRARRADLRRELLTHFDEAGAQSHGLEATLRRFGPEAVVAASFRRVYRTEIVLRHVARVVASCVLSVSFAVVVEALGALRGAVWTSAWWASPRFWQPAGVAVALVLGVVTLWESVRAPFRVDRAVAVIVTYAVIGLIVGDVTGAGTHAIDTATLLALLGAAGARIKKPVVRLAALFMAFASFMYISHRTLAIGFGAGRSMLAGAMLLAVWWTTVLILEWSDRAFGATLSLLAPTAPEARVL